MNFTRLNCVAMCLAGFGLASLAGCGGGNVPAPTAYKQYDNKDSEWNCEYPADWNVKGGGKKNHYGTFTKGSAKIKVSTDLTGSLFGDMAAAAGAGKNPLELTEKDAPVHKVHIDPRNVKEMQDEFSDYKEIGDVIVYRCTLGDARKSEFTAAGGWGGRFTAIAPRFWVATSGSAWSAPAPNRTGPRSSRRLTKCWRALPTGLEGDRDSRRAGLAGRACPAV
jgi:hypothetical protein